MMLDAPVALLAAAADAKFCPRCCTDKPLSAFAANRARADGLQTACRSCRSAVKRAARVVARVERAAPVPAPAGCGPSNLEPGAILLALEQLAAAPKLVVLDGLDAGALPRGLRAFAVRGVDGTIVLPRHALIDWLKGQRARVGEHAMASIGKTDLEVRDVRSEDVAFTRRREARGDSDDL